MEKLIILVFLTTFTGTIVDCAKLSCTFNHRSLTGYTCNLNIDNPNGFDNFTQIYGSHLSGYTSSDVIDVVFSAGSSPIVPKFICQKFPNLKFYSMDIFNFGLKKITKTSFAGCLNLRQIWIADMIGSIEANSLEKNTQLEGFYLLNSDVNVIPSLGNLPNLKQFKVTNSKVFAIDAKFFNQAPGLVAVHTSGNICANKNFDNFNVNRASNLAEFSKCFETFQRQQGFYCNFYYNSNFPRYWCSAKIFNPNSFDNFTKIYGTHQDSYNDLSVELIQVNDGNSPIAPNILCKKFKNLKQIYYLDSSIKRITSSSFSWCTKVFDIWLKYVSVIEAKAFDNNRELTKIYFKENKITTLPSTLFVNAPKLNHVSIFYNDNLRSLPSTIFAKNPNIEYLYLNYNDLQIWYPQWTQSKPKLIDFKAQGNNFEVAPQKAIDSSVLKYLDISHQKISVLNSTCFGDLSKLEELRTVNNGVDAIDVRIVNQAKKLRLLHARQNNCIKTDFNDFHLNRDAFMAQLKPCFEAFGITNLAFNTTTTTGIVFYPIQSTVIEIGVKVAADAIITLASTNSTTSGSRIKITLGASNNEKVKIMESSETIYAVQSNLSASSMTFFTISWSNDGNLLKIDRGVGDERVEIVTYTRSSNFVVNFIGAATKYFAADWEIREIRA